MNVGDKTYLEEDGEIIWGSVVSLDKDFIYIKWDDLESVVKHAKGCFLAKDFFPSSQPLEDQIKELLG